MLFRSFADKARLFDNARPDSSWVVNGDDGTVAAMVREVPGRVFRFSVRHDEHRPYGAPDA